MANKKRLIDANALMELVQFRSPIDNQTAEVIAGCVDITRRLIKNAPTVDAVEVVRCKDCAVPHNKWTGCPKLSGLVPPPDFYCAYGERNRND